MGHILPPACWCIPQSHFPYKREMAQRLRKLYISSAQRVSGTPSSFRWECPIDLSGQGEVHCAATSIVLPHVWYGISNGVNNLFYVRQVASNPASSVNSILTIPEGNYSASALSAKISQLLAGVALSTHSYAVSYSAVTQKITITCSGGSFLVYSDSVLRQQGMIGETALPNPASINQILNTPTSSAAGTSFVSGVITVSKIHQVFIRSPTLANSSTMDSQGRSDALRMVAITTDFGELQVTDGSYEQADLINISGRAISSIQVLLTDSSGREIQMGDIDWSFSLSMQYGSVD
jgi:hypothetical protein